MDFAFSEEQKMLRTMARDFLEAECPKKLVHAMAADDKGYTPQLWRKMADMGWMGLVFPEEYGGTGASLLDLVVLLEEMGRACLPGPFFSTIVLGGLALLEAGNKQQKDEFLPRIIDGSAIFALALTEPATTRYNPALITVQASAAEDGYVINGTKLFVPDANVADYIICAARTGGEVSSREGITLFLLNARSAGIDCTLLKTIASDKQCEVVFDKVQVPGDNMLGELGGGWGYLERLLQLAAVAKCAEMVGNAQQVLDMTTGYARERVQFGHPIGSFQAVQHLCADMIIDIDGARFITYKAAWLLDEGIPCPREVAVAKAWVSEATRRVAARGHQVLGGVGYMMEHDLPLYTLRAKAAELAFGDASYHQEVVARELGL
ncbi:MAG: acyl-CoA dehydrogenase family protein [Chloroflexota bacterium]